MQESPKVISSRGLTRPPLEITGCEDKRLIQIIQINFEENYLDKAANQSKLALKQLKNINF